MTDRRFYPDRAPQMARSLAQLTGADLRGEDCLVEDVSSLEAGSPGTLAFFDGKADLSVPWDQVGAEVLMIPPSVADFIPSHKTLLITPHPYVAFAKAAQALFPQLGKQRPQADWIHKEARIDPSAHISVGAVIGPDVEIGPHCWVGPNSVLGRGVVLGAHTCLEAGVHITHAIIGAHVTICQGTSIGQNGFGFLMDRDQPVDFPHLGRVIIEDNVLIGSCVAIDRGALKDTTIGAGTRIDNLVQIAHNVQVGPGCIIVAQVGIAGSTIIGAQTAIAGQAGITDHRQIGKGVRIAAQSGVMRDIPDGGTVGGSPAVPILEWRKQCVILNQLIRRPKSN